MTSGPPPPPAEPGTPIPAAGGGQARKPIDPLLAAIIITALVVVGAGAAYLLTRDSGGRTASPTTPTTPTVSSTATTSPGTTTTTTEGPPVTGTSSTTTTTVPQPPDGDVSADGTWTVMVYGLGDNNLEPDLLTDMREMRAATAGAPELTFVVLADRAAGFSDESLGQLGDWTSAKLVQITDDRFTELDDWGELNMGEASVLDDFVAAAVTAAPADHYALIFWDHGSMRGLGPDDSAEFDLLEGWELATGLEATLQRTGITLDIIGFDACLMASLEVASVVAPYATFMIASEELEPADGWAYGGFAYLSGDGGTVEGLGESVLQAYFEASSTYDPTVTLSMLDLRQYDQFAAAMGGFTETALSTLDSTAVAIGRRRDAAVKFGEHPDPLQDWFMVDLGQLLGKLARSDTPVADVARDAVDSYNDLVVASVAGPASEGARGLSVHFPPSPQHHYPAWYGAFGDPVWSGFLDAYFGAGRSIPLDRQAAVVDTSPNTTYLFDDYGLEVTAEIEPLALGTVVSADLWSGVPEADGSVVFYSSDQGIVENELAIGFYDLTQLYLSDGVDEALAFQQIGINEDLTIVTITVPLAYAAPIDADNGIWDDAIDVTLVVTYNLETDEFTENVYASSTGTVGAFDPDPYGLFYPVVPYQQPDGTIEWLVTSEVGLWSDLPYLTYDFVEMASGTPLYAELIVADYGGNTATVYVTTEVP